MSRGSKSHSAATWICLAACVLVALLPAGGLAVCLGPDGHFDVGAAVPGGDCPCEHEAEAVAPGLIVFTGDDHPPCRDYALAAPQLYQGPRGVGADDADDRPSQRAQATTPTAASWDLFPRRLDEHRRGPPPDVPRLTLRHLRTVVLLI